MRTMLALASAASITLAAVSFASAQDCVNGYQMLGNDVIVYCQGGPTAAYEEGGVPPATGAAPAGALPDEPLYTGSIGARPPAAPSAAPQTSPMMADSITDCRPGMYWMIEQPLGGDLLMAC